MENFDPFDPKYKEVVDLPLEERGNYIDIKDMFFGEQETKGFVKKEIQEYLENSCERAHNQEVSCGDISLEDAHQENNLRNNKKSQ